MKKKLNVERVVTRILVNLLLWPLEAAMVMWGLDLLADRGFDLPSPGYATSFVISFALGLLYGAVRIGSNIDEEDAA